MLRVFDHLDELTDTNFYRRVPLRHLASELVEEFGYKREEDLLLAMNEAFNLCMVMHIPINLHFRKVYLYEKGGLITDWMLSDFGSYLLLVNGNTSNPYVARARVQQFIKNH